ncbi:hypothetical protein Btru_072356 [Bulinus truncatus]|nr:hypothetical protein Btru_072356 [Bulinus truncatus]
MLNLSSETRITDAMHQRDQPNKSSAEIMRHYSTVYLNESTLSTNQHYSDENLITQSQGIRTKPSRGMWWSLINYACTTHTVTYSREKLNELYL